MKALYTIRNKGKIAMMFCALIGLELFACISNEQNMSEMEDTFSKVYSDRLLAQDYIYKLEDQIYRRKLMFSAKVSSSLQTNYKNLTGLKSPLENYSETKFTKNEAKLFKEFSKSMEALNRLEENIIINTNVSGKQGLISEHDKLTNTLLGQLQELSDIQLSEGKSLEISSKKILAHSNLLSHFNWAMIIILGIVIQVLVFSSKATLPKQLQNEYLN